MTAALAGAVEATLALDMPQGSGPSLRAQYLKAEEMGEPRHPHFAGLLEAAQPPPGLSGTWESYWEMREAAAGSGPVPLAHGEMLAWARLTGYQPMAREVGMWRAMDRAYLGFWRNQREESD